MRPSPLLRETSAPDRSSDRPHGLAILGWLLNDPVNVPSGSKVRIALAAAVGSVGSGGWRQREPVLPGWSIGHPRRLSFTSCGLIAISGPHLVPIDPLIIGPVCVLLTPGGR